jgi:hypothetical protein
LSQTVERLADRVDLTVDAVGERRHRQFDDLVARGVQARRLDVDHQALADL